MTEPMTQQRDPHPDRAADTAQAPGAAGATPSKRSEAMTNERLARAKLRWWVEWINQHGAEFADSATAVDAYIAAETHFRGRDDLDRALLIAAYDAVQQER